MLSQLPIPQPFRHPIAVLVLTASVVVATLGVVSYVKVLAQENAEAAVSPLRTKNQDIERRLERIEHKVDRLLERK